MDNSPSHARLYEPLKDGQFRLITIDKSELHSGVPDCRMEVFDIAKAIAYKALSYAWGDPKVTGRIKVNGVSIQKTTNLVSALAQLRQIDNIEYLWIDAICIDQQNKAEKSKQVRIMGDIYRNAQEVLIWLGAASDDSCLGIAFLKEWSHAGFCYLMLQKEIKDNISASTDRERKEKVALYERSSDSRRVVCQALSQIKNPYGIPEWIALANIFKRPFWKRVWVLQEMSLARQARLLCGQATSSFSTLAPMVIAALMKDADQRKVWADYGLRSPEPLLLSWGQVSRGGLPLLLAAGGVMELIRNNFCRLVQQTLPALATDPRDKIYALLALVPPERTSIIVDYSRSVSMVYTDFVLSEIRATGKLSTLCLFQTTTRSGATLNLPSWVPDLIAETSHYSYLSREAWGNFDAAGGQAARCSVSEDLKTLNVDGFRYCIIEHVGNGAPLGGTEPRPDLVKDVFCRWFSLVTKSTLHKNWVSSEGFNIAQPFFRTICLDENNARESESPSSNLQKRKILADKTVAFTCWLQNQTGVDFPSIDLLPFLSSLSELDSPSDQPILIEDAGYPAELGTDIVGLKADGFTREFETLAKTSAFFVSEQGFMGTGPKGVLPGDVVCVLLGSDLPIILRPCGNEYGVVGPCYMCGIMYGELVIKMQQEEREGVTFTLR
jgi:hypothetical protein